VRSQSLSPLSQAFHFFFIQVKHDAGSSGFSDQEEISYGSRFFTGAESVPFNMLKS